MHTSIRPLPTPEETARMPAFKALSSDRIHLIKTAKDFQSIKSLLSQYQILGFDTESKPTFQKGEISTGPHLIQLASLDSAFLFQVNPETLHCLKQVLSDPSTIKVGFGLKNDAKLFNKRDIEVRSMLDLSKAFSPFGFRQTMGIKNAVAITLNQNFRKSKISTSNWAKSQLSVEQINYAAADAYAALKVFQYLFEMGMLSDEHAKLIKGINLKE